MNPETGEIKDFNWDDIIPPGWTAWEIGEPVMVKNCYFRVNLIIPAEKKIILEGISEEEFYKSHDPKEEAK